jgi:hypothetical protein
MSNGYYHKAALGCWINDMRNSALPTEEWPSISIDEETEDSLSACLDLAKNAGYDSLNVFGLLANYSWSADIAGTVPEERRAKVERIRNAVRARGMKLIYGLGVFSWGFDEIIAKNPGIQGTNPHAMCFSSPESFEWMKKVLDYVLAYGFDGFHLEASDQGRCHCEKCSAYSDFVYYSRINAMCADYIRERKKDAVLMVNMCGYVPVGSHVGCEEDFQALVELSGHIDYLIDAGHRGFYIRGEYRKRAFAEFQCAFGSSSGTWVYMPQRWDKLRWLLPTVLHSCGYLQEDYRRGARAAEIYMGATVNPGVEMTILCCGKLLNDPERDVGSIMREAVEELYAPKNREACEKLVDVFTQAETSYFANVNPLYIERDFLGEMYMEPVCGTSPGNPIYLYERNDLGENIMFAGGRAAYRDALRDMLSRLDALENEVGKPEKVRRIRTCIEHVLSDIASIESN